MSKLAALILIVGGSLLFVGAAAAQGEPGDSSAAQPVYAAPGGAGAGPGAARDGRIKDNGPHRRPMTASIMLSTPWRYGFGVGFTGGFEIPIVHNGFIPSINNSFSLEPFITIGWSSYNHGYGFLEDDVHAWQYTPGIAGLWSFYFTPKLRAYAAARFGVTIISPGYDGDYRPKPKFENDTDVFVELAPGVVYNVTPRIALRGDIGWFSGIKGGIAILL